jgi:hypothetical protein
MVGTLRCVHSQNRKRNENQKIVGKRNSVKQKIVLIGSTRRRGKVFGKNPPGTTVISPAKNIVGKRPNSIWDNQKKSNRRGTRNKTSESISSPCKT